MNEQKPDFIEEQNELQEVVIEIKRTSKKTKGGDRLGFTCLAVVGDGAGSVGVALGKAPLVRDAVRKAMRKAKTKLVSFPVVGEAKTIPHAVEVAYKSSRILLKPAPAGTGIRAGGAVRSVLEVSGLENIVAKRLGSANKKVNVDTTIKALLELKSPEERVHLRMSVKKPATKKKAAPKSRSAGTKSKKGTSKK